MHLFYHIYACIYQMHASIITCANEHKAVIFRVGQNHIYTVFIRYFWQGIHQKYGHVQWKYTVLANPSYFATDSLLTS